jgi:hypothetical protein
LTFEWERLYATYSLHYPLPPKSKLDVLFSFRKILFSRNTDSGHLKFVWNNNKNIHLEYVFIKIYIKCICNIQLRSNMPCRFLSSIFMPHLCTTLNSLQLARSSDAQNYWVSCLSTLFGIINKYEGYVENTTCCCGSNDGSLL